jgi:hypothetical protein
MKSIVLDERHRKLLHLSTKNLLNLDSENDAPIYSREWQKFLKKLGQLRGVVEGSLNNPIDHKVMCELLTS